ncbi:MAG: tetratricopeptide repeat protein [Arsenophonus sp.]|nr:MAG: tetratricopeptide repeat protein [Arsenophonus sp.]
MNSVFNDLLLVKKYVDNHQLNKAEKMLKNILKNVKEENIRTFISIKLARIQLQNNQIKKALSTLNQIKLHGWNGLINLIRGDIFLKNNQIKESILMYSQGIKDSEFDAIKYILNIKLNRVSNYQGIKNEK